MNLLLVTLVSAALLAQLALAHRKAVSCLRRRDLSRPEPLASYPSVTVVRPVKGTDVEQEVNFRAALDTGYPGEIETIFVFEDESDPAWARARRAIADREEAHPGELGPGEARIVLNSVAVYPGGSHERIWYAMASGRR